MATSTITHEALAARIFSELTAVLGPLYSDHLLRGLTSGDVLDALHVATDDGPTVVTS